MQAAEAVEGEEDGKTRKREEGRKLTKFGKNGEGEKLRDACG